jgi:hypothetical protein
MNSAITDYEYPNINILVKDRQLAQGLTDMKNI